MIFFQEKRDLRMFLFLVEQQEEVEDVIDMGKKDIIFFNFIRLRGDWYEDLEGQKFYIYKKRMCTYLLIFFYGLLLSIYEKDQEWGRKVEKVCLCLKQKVQDLSNVEGRVGE